MIVFNFSAELAGALYSKQDISSASYRPLEPITVGNFLQWDGEIERPEFSDTPSQNGSSETQQGVYAALALNLHDKVTAIVGNRISDYEVESNSGGYEHNSVNTPYIGLIYEVSEYISAYTSYTEIFQPQNYRNASNERLEPVEGVNVEAGVKGDLFREALTASFAVFRVKEDNVAQLDPTNNAPLPDGSFPCIGVEGAESEGYELEITGKVSDVLNLYFSFTHNNSTAADGSKFAPYLPEDMVRASALYQTTEDWNVGINAHWQSEISQPGAGPNGETFRQGSYSIVALMASYALYDNVDVSLNVNNVFDEKYYSSIDFYNQGFFGAPHNAQLSIKYAW